MKMNYLFDDLLKQAAINEFITGGQSIVLNDLNMLAKRLNLSITIIGGVAVQMYKYARFTGDVDILMKTADASSLAHALIELGYEDIGENKFRHVSGFEVNICADSVYAGQGLKFDSPTALPGTIDVVSLQKLLATKIESNRSKDRGDFVELVKINDIPLQTIQSDVIPLIRTKLGKIAAIQLWNKAQRE